MEQKCGEIGKLQEEGKKHRAELEKADQVNSELRGKTLDKELEAESLPVVTCIV